MAVLGLRFCARAFSSCGKWGPLFIVVRGPLIIAASFVGSTGSRRAGSVVVAHGPSCSTACGIFPDQGSNPCPLHWQADSQPLCHQGSPLFFFKIFFFSFWCGPFLKSLLNLLLNLLLLLFFVLVFWPRGMWDLSALTKDWTRTPWIGRLSLNHWTTREVPWLTHSNHSWIPNAGKKNTTWKFWPLLAFHWWNLISGCT